MPFFIGNILELPLTTTQDYALQVLTDEWEEAGTEAERSVEELARLRSSRTEG